MLRCFVLAKILESLCLNKLKNDSEFYDYGVNRIEKSSREEAIIPDDFTVLTLANLRLSSMNLLKNSKSFPSRYRLTFRYAIDVLVIGDSTGYTTALFSNIFQNCTLATIHNFELTDLRKKLKDINVIQFEDVSGKFDIIFFDAGFYNKSTMHEFLNVLKNRGSIVYFSRSLSPEFTEKQFDFFDVSINLLTKNEEKVLFKSSLLFNSTVIV
jgi:hypothetical protein